MAEALVESAAPPAAHASGDAHVDDAALAEARERALLAHYADGREGMRSVPATLGLVLLAAIFALLPLWPFAEGLLGVGVEVTLPVALVAGGAIAHAAFAFHRAGALGRWYRVAEHLESIASVFGGFALLVASGSSVSVFWLLFALFIFDAQNNPLDVEFCVGVLGAGALTAAACFAFSRHLPDAGITVALGVFACASTWALGVSARKRVLLEAERGFLRDRLEGLLVERERDRIARDLHDGVGADLSALVWRARALREQLGDEAAIAAVDDMVAHARRSLEDLRDVVREMRGAGQDWSAFTQELHARAVALAGPSLGVTVTFRDEDGCREVPTEVRGQVLRVVQEALQNAARHARARTAHVEVVRGRSLRVRVEDDGVGIPAEVVSASQGGLSHIRERARALDGTLVVSEAGEGAGVRLEVTLPLPAPPP